MTWDEAELSAASSIVERLDADAGPRQTIPRPRTIRLRASAAEGLKAGCCGHKSLIVRHLYRALGFDEHRLFRHRLEHKLVQALVLQHYCPGVVPVTRGVRRELEGVELAEMQAHLERVCAADGALIKASLGYGSGERKQIEVAANCAFDCPSTFDARVSARGSSTCSVQLQDEAFVLQERIAIEEEYRVHTVEGRVAPDLTYRRYGWGILPDERDAPNAFVQRAIDRLPNGFVRGALIAWDVAKIRAPQDAGDGDGDFAIIEANLAGYHPVFDPGFQSSGFFQGPWGPTLVARLFAFVEQTYGISVQVEVDVPADTIEHDVYWWPARWHELFRIAGNVGSLSDAVDRLHSVRTAPSENCPQDRRAFITLLSRLEHVSRALTSLA